MKHYLDAACACPLVLLSAGVFVLCTLHTSSAWFEVVAVALNSNFITNF
jgi:hypothetical protein